MFSKGYILPKLVKCFKNGETNGNTFVYRKILVYFGTKPALVLLRKLWSSPLLEPIGLVTCQPCPERQGRPPVRRAGGKAVGTLPEHKHSTEEGATGWCHGLLLFVCLAEGEEYSYSDFKSQLICGHLHKNLPRYQEAGLDAL